MSYWYTLEHRLDDGTQSTSRMAFDFEVEIGKIVPLRGPDGEEIGVAEIVALETTIEDGASTTTVSFEPCDTDERRDDEAEDVLKKLWRNDAMSFAEGHAEFVDELTAPDWIGELCDEDLIAMLHGVKDGVKASEHFAKQVEAELVSRHNHGDRVDAPDHWAEIKNQVYRSKWQRDDLIEALRPQILWDVAGTGEQRSAEMVFQLLVEVGVLGAGPSVRALAKYGIDPADYCTELGTDKNAPNLRAIVKPR